MQKKESVVAGAALALVLYTLALSVLGPVVSAALRNQTISNAGSVKAIGVGVYWDQACTISVPSIDWGLLEPNSSTDRVVFIRNDGNTVAHLSMTTANWNPANASNYMALNWDYSGQTFNPNEVIQARLILSVSADVTGIGDFSFEIVIAASD